MSDKGILGVNIPSLEGQFSETSRLPEVLGDPAIQELIALRMRYGATEQEPTEPLARFYIGNGAGPDEPTV